MTAIAIFLAARRRRALRMGLGAGQCRRLAKPRRSGQTLAGTDGYLGNLGLTRLRTCAPRPGRGRCEALGCGRRSAAPIRELTTRGFSQDS